MLAALFSYSVTAQAQVTINAVTPNLLCAGSLLTVSYTNTGSGQATLSVYLYDTNTTDSLYLAQTVNYGGTSSINAYIPTNQPTGVYKVGIKRVTSQETSISSKSSSFTINAIPSSPTVSNVSYCQYTSPGSLSASGTNLKWYTVQVGGTSSSVAPTPSTFTPGNTTYYVSQSINGCESPRTGLNVTISAMPSAPVVVSPLLYCQGVPSSPLVAIASIGGTLNWYGTNAAGGIPSSASLFPQTSIAGITNYYVSQTVTGCEGPRAAISVTVKPIPSSPVTNSVTYCQGSSASMLTATKSPGGNLLWYTSQTGGTGSSTAFTPQTTTPGTFTFYVSQTINGCESPRASLNVTVNPVPSVTITPEDPVLSPTQTSLTLTAAASASALIWSTSETTTSILVSTAGTYSVTATASNGCMAMASINVIQIAVGEIYTLKTGDWNDPTVWSSNQIPGHTNTVRIRHSINLPTNTQIQVGSLNYTSGGQLVMQNNIGLQIGL
ncbi:hypothetical protein GCM10028809_03410 [Spirosoma gilvum]